MKKEKLPDKEESKQESEQEAEELESKEIVETEEKVEREKTQAEEIKEKWKARTVLGKKVLSGEITDIDDILDKGLKILEPEIIDVLLPDVESDLLLIGQARGKFGGGQRRVFKQTQKKTPEGNKISFITYGIVGNKNGYIGLGWGKSNETVPARNKATREAKLNVKKIRRGCGSWLCGCGEPHSIPFKVSGKSGSIVVELRPAPKGKGLIIEEECGKILKMAGIKDVFCKTKGNTKTKTNLVRACFEALKNSMKIKVNPQLVGKVGLIEGKVKNE